MICRRHNIEHKSKDIIEYVILYILIICAWLSCISYYIFCDSRNIYLGLMFNFMLMSALLLFIIGCGYVWW